MAYNVKRLCAVGDFENGIFNLPQKLNSSSNAQLTTSAPIAQNTCYKLVRFISTELELKNETFFFSFLCGGEIKNIEI